MRFLADMGVSQRVVEWPRREGRDAIHLREERLQRLDDRGIFSKAIAERRIVLTFDLDFGEIAAFIRNQPASIIVFRLRNDRSLHVIERLKAVLPDCAKALENGAVVSVEDSRHRVRFLPIGKGATGGPA